MAKRGDNDTIDTTAPQATPNTRACRRGPWTWIRRGLLGAIALALLAAATLLIVVFGWDYPVSDLERQKAGPLIFLSRDGIELGRLAPTDTSGERNAPASEWVSLDQVPPIALATFLVSEDDQFFAHSGVSIEGVGRAALLDLKAGKLAYGGSTITMQLIRMLHSAGQQRTLRNKIKEAVLAMRLERALDKRSILEHYVNRAYFGNGAHGIEAAAQTYFGVSASALSVGQATLLAVLPRAPSAYDPIAHLDRALLRREHIFGQLEDAGILSRDEIERARGQALSPRVHRRPRLAQHFLDWIRGELPPSVTRQGGVITTTLDLRLQTRLEEVVRSHIASLAERGLEQAGMVVLDTQTGEVLAMVGSADYDGKDGQINITTWRRHPGSALKPFVYALAIERGDHPASIAYDIHDVPSDYRVRHLTQTERGPVRYREALAGSYNLAAVHTLERVGVERLLTVLRRAGVGPLDGQASDYGLRLALGSAKIRLLDLAAAYGFLGRGGTVRAPRGVRTAQLGGGVTWQPKATAATRIFSPETSFLVMDMLSDPQARRPAFGQELPVDLPFPIAVKTGTARGFSDTVAVGVTREFTVAAWAGTFTGRPTQGLTAMTSAAPLVREGMLAASRGGPSPTLPARPEGVVPVTVCAQSGMLPGRFCPHRKHDFAAAGHLPGETCTWHRADGLHLPAVARPWAERERTRGGRHVSSLAP